eukprot:7613112-Pyramimonas_sp.AAC.1
MYAYKEHPGRRVQSCELGLLEVQVLPFELSVRDLGVEEQCAAPVAVLRVALDVDGSLSRPYGLLTACLLQPGDMYLQVKELGSDQSSFAGYVQVQ